MPDQPQSTSPPCAFTAPFLTHHGDPEEAELLRRAGEVLARDRGGALPREAVPPAAAAGERLTSLAEELAALAEWLRGSDGLVEDLLEGGEVEAAHGYALLGAAGRHLAALAAVLEEAEQEPRRKARRWAAERSPGPAGAFQDWLAAMAAVMRRWGLLTRERAEGMLPTLPDARTRRLMSLADEESFEVSLFHFRDTVIGDILAASIAGLEDIAAERPGVRRQATPQGDVHREIDPTAFEGWEEGDGE